MEDGLNGGTVLGGVEPDVVNGVTSFSENEEAVKVNGDSNEECSSESDVLVIDEKRPTSPLAHHFNPYFNESIFELSQQHHFPKVKKSPKLREYAQYLGLQPTVQFKCSRCGRAGFESLTTLNEHIVQCTDEPCAEPPEDNPNGFKLTRKVFLCSACGTYYENWNLYLHMIEVHKRYLCLYCLGMFSVLDDLCLHIQSRHNLEPGHKDSLDDFFTAYTEPCYIVCCECNKLFNEQENFFYHNCTGAKKPSKPPSKAKKQIKPEDHVTGESSSQNPAPDQAPIETCHDDRSEIVYSTDDELDFRGFAVETTQDMVDDHTPPSPEIQDMALEPDPEPPVETVETRKVPKLSLKLKPGAFPQIEPNSEDEPDTVEEEIISRTPSPVCEEPEMKVAGADVSIIELELEQPLDKFDIRVLLQKCLKATASTCLYCNHARKIAVNGAQLGLHAIGEHRFSAIVSSITAEELIPESFVTRIKECLPELTQVYFNLECSLSDEAVTFSHVFECFQCRYSTLVHKELYLHNRKLHTKNLLLCIMCKLNFYSYSELICHLCPGVYILDYDVGFRCCMCVGDDIPSAFRLMVHLRKRHHVCDVCLEMCHNQYKLSNHVWKHKLHHFCYRCGIAYRNKPDITRHLFWKHGTESVLCKKCLQKKWPHVYHFCVPPLSFTCDECQLTFSRAVSLKVHKRIHTEERPHACTVEGCVEKFISKKLVAKHELKHQESVEEVKPMEPPQELIEVVKPVEDEEKVKPKVDVYDLPALNLSESDSDSEPEPEKKPEMMEIEVPQEAMDEPVPLPVPVENIWDDFKNYQANKEKFDHLFEPEKVEEEPPVFVLTAEIALRDHDYILDPDNKPDVSFTEVKPDLNQSVDHDYCTAKAPKAAVEVAPPVVKKDSSSDSSSDSDSSCSCGPNCSCSSSSGSSSSSSDSSESDSSTEEGRRRQQVRREKKKQRLQHEQKVDVTTTSPTKEPAIVCSELPILESDLETTESDTDEEFYDKQPQLIAKKILEEKRNQLLAGVGTPNGSRLGSRPPTPNLPDEEVQVKKKKSKSKKKKKKKKLEAARLQQSYYQYYQPPTVAPITLTLARNSPVASHSVNSMKLDSDYESDLNLRASKRRRVPNKFYGYSSDEEEKLQGKQWRKVEVAPPLIVPPITIKAPPVVQPKVPPLKIKNRVEEAESEGESNDSSNEGRNMLQVNPDALYCYCKCPYDEVSEMIGCDSRDCSIEWFHFECVGIMVPPKGHWYCPECRKKRQQKREAIKLKLKTA